MGAALSEYIRANTVVKCEYFSVLAIILIRRLTLNLFGFSANHNHNHFTERTLRK